MLFQRLLDLQNKGHLSGQVPATNRPDGQPQEWPFLSHLSNGDSGSDTDESRVLNTFRPINLEVVL